MIRDNTKSVTVILVHSRTDTVKVISILSPIAFYDLCKQFQHYKNHFFFPQLDRGEEREKKNMSAPNCVISIWQFARGRWITHELPFNNSARNVESCHTVSLCLSHTYVNERVYQSMRECDVFVCCIGVNVIVGECYSLTGAVDIANGVYTTLLTVCVHIKSTPKSQILTYSILVFVQLPIWHLVHCFSKSSVVISIVSVDVGSQRHFIICIVVTRNSGPTNFSRECACKNHQQYSNDLLKIALFFLFRFNYECIETVWLSYSVDTTFMYGGFFSGRK